MSISKRINHILHKAFHTESAAIFSLWRLDSKNCWNWEFIGTVLKRTCRYLWLTLIRTELKSHSNHYFLKKKKISADWLDRHLKSKLFSPILVSEPLTQSSPSLLPDAMNTEWKAVHHSRIFCSLTIQARRIKHIIPGPRKCLKPHSLWIKRKKEKMHLFYFSSPPPPERYIRSNRRFVTTLFVQNCHAGERGRKNPLALSRHTS